jgi:hypothetical protein
MIDTWRSDGATLHLLRVAAVVSDVRAAQTSRLWLVIDDSEHVKGRFTRSKFL